MRVLLTGGLGFIGGHLADRLDNVEIMDKKNGTSTVDFELLSKTVESYKPDIIVHLGANCSSQISLREPLTDFQDNVIGTINVLEIARLHNLPVIFNSTMKVFQGDDGVIPPYGRSKQVGEDYIKTFHDVYGLEYVINRPSSVYGPRQDASEDGGWFTWFIKASVENKPVTLFGDGTQSRDVLYVQDCVDLLIDQIENFDKYKNDDYTFGGGLENEVSLNELLEELDYTNIRRSDRLKGDVQRFVCDNVKVSSVNGWKANTHWKEGLNATISYCRTKSSPAS